MVDLYSFIFGFVTGGLLVLALCKLKEELKK